MRTADHETGRDATAIQVQQWDDPETWDAFVEARDGPVFATWGWGTVCAESGHDRLYLGATQDGDLVGALPLVYMQSRLFGDKLVSLPYSEYGSVLVESGVDDPAAVERRLLAAATGLADDHAVDFVSLRGRDLADGGAFDREQRWVTFEVPLSDGADAVWDAYDSSRRNHIRDARDHDLTVTVGETLADLRDFYGLYLRTMRGHGSPPLPFRFFRALWHRLHPAGHMRLYVVTHDGKPVNAAIDFPFGSSVYHWKEVSNYAYRDLQGGSFVVWRAMRWAAETGYETYNFGRTREGTGVYAYKKSFGGRKTWLTDYHYWPDETGELPNPESDRYEPLQRVWRRLPLVVTRLVGPPIRTNISL